MIVDARSDSTPPTSSVAESKRSSADVWLLIACYAGLYIVIGMLVNGYVLTPALVDRTWIEAGAGQQIEKFAARRDTWRFYGYLLTPLLVVIKIGFPAVCLSVGCALIDWDVRFADLYRAATQAETTWAIAAVIHLACVLYIVEIKTVVDFSTFYPLSALHFVDLGEEHLWAVYFLKTLNLFEIGYVASVTAGLRHVIRRPLAARVAFVVLSYGSGTLLFVSAVTFLMLALT